MWWRQDAYLSLRQNYQLTNFFIMNQLNNKVKLILKNCIGCGECVKVCPTNAIPQTLIGYISTLAEIDTDKCDGCGECVRVCSYGAIDVIRN